MHNGIGWGSSILEREKKKKKDALCSKHRVSCSVIPDSNALRTRTSHHCRVALAHGLPQHIPFRVYVYTVYIKKTGDTKHWTLTPWGANVKKTAPHVLGRWQTLALWCRHKAETHHLEQGSSLRAATTAFTAFS